MRLDKPNEAPKAGKIMLLLLATLYLISIALVLYLEPFTSFSVKESPFVVSLVDYKLAFVPHIFNAALIIAGFSTMTASLFAVTTMVVTLANERDAPSIFAANKKRAGKKPITAYGLTATGLIASVVFALLMPESVYEYITTAAGLMLLYNWLFILLTSGKLLKSTGWGKTKRYLGFGLIALAVSGTWFHPISRPGFFISLGFIAVIALLTLIMRHFWNKEKQEGTNQGTKDLPKQGAESFKSKIETKANQRNPRNNRDRGKQPIG